MSSTYLVNKECEARVRGFPEMCNAPTKVRRTLLQFDFIKLYSYLSQDEFQRAVATAKKVGMYTAGHIPFQVGLEGVLEGEGVDIDQAGVGELEGGNDRQRHEGAGGDRIADRAPGLPGCGEESLHRSRHLVEGTIRHEPPHR